MRQHFLASYGRGSTINDFRVSPKWVKKFGKLSFHFQRINRWEARQSCEIMILDLLVQSVVDVRMYHPLSHCKLTMAPNSMTENGIHCISVAAALTAGLMQCGSTFRRIGYSPSRDFNPYGYCWKKLQASNVCGTGVSATDHNFLICRVRD